MDPVIINLISQAELGGFETAVHGRLAAMFHGFVHKMCQALTFSATIENDHRAMKTLAVISILALLTISGAAYTDQLLTSDQHTKRVN